MVLKSPVPDSDSPNLTLARYALECMQNYRDLVALVDPFEDRTWTFGELRQKSIELALKLRTMGLQKGDFVGLVVDFRAESFPVLVALGLCNATAVLGNINAKANEVAKQLNRVGVKFCLCESARLKQELKAVLSTEVVLDFSDVHKLAASGEESVLHEVTPSEDVDAHEDPVFVAFSSGSTGEPKAIVTTNARFMHNIHAARVSTGVETGDCMLTLCRQVHIFGVLTWYLYISAGAKHVLTTRLTPEMFVKCVQRYGLTGAMVSDFVAVKNIAQTVDLKQNTLRFFVTIGAKMPKAVLEGIREKLKVVVTSAYGSSEAGHVSCSVSEQTSLDGVGKLCTNVQLKVADPANGKELGVGQTGELLLKSPSIFKCYLGNDEATQNAFDEQGWFRTGDLGYYDDQGVVYVIERLKNVIKSQGNMNVYPAVLEAALLAHPGVAEAAVVATAHPIYNEAAKAFVVRQDESLTKEDLLKFYNAQVAEYQQLFGGLEFIDHIPKTGLGKQMKLALV